MTRLPAPPLLLVTDLAQARWPLGSIIASAFAAGCRWISIREKHLTREQQIALVAEARSAAASGGLRLTIHGDAELALAARTDGVHLPAGADPVAARAQLGESALIGLSVHAVAEVGALSDIARAALDYVIAGPAYPSASKPGYRGEVTESGYAALVRRCGELPMIAIGGIEPGNVASLIDDGVAGIAVMGGVMRAPDIGVAVCGYLTALNAAACRSSG